jgi:hypothetical protein
MTTDIDVALADEDFVRSTAQLAGYTDAVNLRSNSTSQGPSTWPYWLGASAVGICSAETAFELASGPERYTQFTVGSITWRTAAKHADYTLLLGLIAGFAAAWLALLLVERRIERRLGAEGIHDLRSLVAYAALPLVIWAGGLVLGGSPTRDLVWLSAAGVCLAGGLMLVAASRPPGQDTGIAPGAAAGLVLLATVFGALSPLIGAFAINRLALSSKEAFVWTGTPSPLWLATAGGLVILAIGVWGMHDRSPSSSSRRLRVMLLCAQLAIPWGFLAVVPSPWAAASAVRMGGPIGTIPWVVFALVAVAYLDLLRRGAMALRNTPDLQRPLNVLSPLVVAGGLLFIKLAPIRVAHLPGDDYHFGEYLLPWWSLTAHSAVPFLDYVPARGLINYLDAALASLTFGTTAAGIAAAIGLVSAVVLIVGLAALSTWIGLLPAAAAFLMLPLDSQPTQVDILNTAALVVLLVAYTRLTATIWLLLWTLLGTMAFLTAPAQGVILVVATAPLGVWQLTRALRHERSSLLRVAAAAAVLGGVLVLTTPLGHMILGALRYAREHSAVSGPAHGFEWVLSAAAPMPLNRWLFEAVRTSWMIVGMCAIALMLSAWVRKDSQRRNTLLLVAIPILVMSIFFIYRAAGRIDPGWVSRLGYASVWMIGLVLPLLLHAAWGGRQWPLILTLTVAGSSTLTPQVGGLLSLQAIGSRALESDQPPARIVRGFGPEAQNIGRAGMTTDQLDRLSAIRGELAILLDPTETYLDLTNRNAEYFYLGREVPIESGAIYNLPNDRQQQRAIERLSARQIPVVLALADSQVYDGAPPSYRVATIYRYLVTRYVPLRIGPRIYMVKPDRLERLASHPEITADRNDPLGLLDSVFRLEDLQGLPASWGASWQTLEPSVTQVRQLGRPTVLQNAQELRAGEYESASNGAAIGWDLSSRPLFGKDAGILTFDFDCHDSAGNVALNVRWAAAGASPDQTTTVRFHAAPRLAVPLDASPRWLLNPAIGSLELGIADTSACRKFSVTNVVLWQRHMAAAADALR